MAKLSVLQRRFSRGMRRDTPRDSLPDDVAYNLIDYLPDLQAPLRKRGGDTYYSNDITAVTATASYVIGGLVAPYAAATKVLAFDEDGRLYTIAANGTVTDIGAAVVVAQNPVFHRDKAIITAAGGATAPKYYDGSTLGALAGSPPNAVYATVHKDRTVLARTSADPTRLWFSDAGDPTGWDTTTTYWDTTHPVTGLASIRNAILVFSEEGTERLVGSTPPPDTDFSLGSLFDEGCTDARSIAYWGEKVLWANPSGIFITDGSAMDDVTKAAGMLRYWNDTVMAGYSTSTHTIVGGCLSSYYFVAVMNGSTFVDAALIDIEGRRWLRLSNWKARAMWPQTSPDELYVGRRDAARVSKTSPIFSPQSSNKNDADGTAVTPIYETGFYQGNRMEVVNTRRLFVLYDIRDAATDNPTLIVSYLTSPESSSYTALSPTLTETTEITKTALDVNDDGYGFAFKIAQTNASSDTRLYALAADLHPREGSRTT
jgi:hypothetical protein